MLTSLEVKDLAIIEKLKIDFSDGFNVIIGETGAGKSILVRALTLLFGSKARCDAVRDGAKQAVISGGFQIPWGHKAVSVLEKYGLMSDGDDEYSYILVRRTISAKGRSQAWINDTAVTIATLKELSDSLVDVFGQHEGGRLLDSAHHQAYLDQFLQKPTNKTAVLTKYEKCSALVDRLTSISEEFRSKRRDADYLSFRCSELTNFSPSVTGYEKERALCERAKGVLSHQETLQKARTLIDEGASGDAVSTPVWEVSRILEQIEGDEKTAALSGEATRLAGELDELSYSINSVFTSLDIDEESIERAQKRVSAYQDLFRKLNVKDAGALVEEEKRLQKELSFLQSAENDASMIMDDLEKSCRELTASCEELTKDRKAARNKFKKKVERELKELAMSGAKIDVRFLPVSKTLDCDALSLFGDGFQKRWKKVSETLSHVGPGGSEKAQFILSANKGESFQPLHKVASGGEMSRITLAIKKALVTGADTCILVFDEIDAGISGRVADIVGKKMKEISNSMQVICISHLAQVAAYAKSHFVVEKRGSKERTVSEITKMTEKRSVEEIAKLLSGCSVTTSSLANAKNLVKRAGGH